MKMKKTGIMIIASMILSAAFGTVCFAGEWRKDNTGYWWENEDGSRLVSCWKWLDGNRDGSAQCFYFDQNGYAAVNTEINGFQLNEKGAWTVNGLVQNRNLSANDSAENRQVKGVYKRFLEEEEQKANAEGYANGKFHILDINQDGIEELLFWGWPFGFSPAVYAFQYGKMVEVCDGRRYDGMSYDRVNKAMRFDLAAHGYYYEWMVYFNGEKWVTDDVPEDQYGNSYLEESGYGHDAGWIEGVENNLENRSKTLD